MTVLRSATSRLAYWTGVSPPRPFFGRSSLYSRRPAGLSERFSVPCSFARRMQDIESDTGYDTRRPAPDAVNVYHDFASGVRDDRPGLDSCLRALRKGDVGGIARFVRRITLRVAFGVER